MLNMSLLAVGKIYHKVCSKTRPTHIFNVTDGDKYQEHVVARRLGSMECIFLLLGERICNLSAVKYLTTEMLIQDPIYLFDR